MITMLHSWSFELNLNKSFGTPDPSIPVPSYGHSARQNSRLPFVGDEVTSRFSGPLVCPLLVLSSLRIIRGTFPLQPVAVGIFRHLFISWSLGFGPWAFSSGPRTFSSFPPSLSPVNALNRPAIHVCNPLIARVRTDSHENKIFFSKKCRALSTLSPTSQTPN
jgi:hypothetical protein